MVNRKIVAEMAGVSTATVTRVTSGKGYVSEEARLKVEEAIKKLNYRPNQLAQNLRWKKSNIIAVIAEDILNPYNSELIEKMFFEARQRGYIISLFLLTEYERRGGLRGIVDEICANRFVGVINMALDYYFSEEDIERLGQLNIRMVNVPKLTSQQSTSDFDMFRLDYESAMRDAYKILKQKGRKKVAFVSGVSYIRAVGDPRYRAYCKLSREYGMTEDENLVIYGDYPVNKYPDLGYKAVQKLYDEKIEFDAIFCLTDIIAQGVIKGLQERGKNIPQDVSLFACDNIQLSEMISPALTTIDTLKKEIAEAYIKYIFNEEQEYPIQLKAKFIRRQSL